MAMTDILGNIPVVLLVEDYWRDRRHLPGAGVPGVRPRRSHIAGALRCGVYAWSGGQSVCVADQSPRLLAPAWLGSRLRSAGLPTNLLTMDDPEHAWHRRILHPAFAVRRIDGYLPLITRAIDRRLEQWATRGVIDAYFEETRVIAFDVAAEAFLGIRPGPDLALCRAVFLHGAHQREAEYTALLRRAIDERRARPTDDALGLLAAAGMSGAVR